MSIAPLYWNEKVPARRMEFITRLVQLLTTVFIRNAHDPIDRLTISDFQFCLILA